MERLLPQNIEAECGVLGSIIIDPEAIAYVADFLYPDDFYRDAHQQIYEVILALHEQRTPADFITLCDELERRNRLEEVGGASYITSLINQVPTSGNVEYYGRIVERTSILRRLISAAGRIAAIAYEEADADTALNMSEQILYSVRRRIAGGGFVSNAQLMQLYVDELERLQEKKQDLTGVPTGYADLDDVLGGLQKKDLIILAARPGVGKSALGVSIAYNAAVEHGLSSAVFSLEMGKEQLARRQVSMDSGIDQQRLRRGWIGDEEWDSLTATIGKLAGLPIWTDDASGNPIMSMRAKLRRLFQQQGHIDLVVVDYLQLIDPDESEERRYENRVQEVSKISRGLKAIAREFDVPVLAMAQLSRKVEERQNKRPLMADLRDSGAIEQDADVILFLYRDDYYADQESRPSMAPNIAELNIAKQRNGPIGEVDLFFQAERTMFYDLDERLTPEEIAAWEAKKKMMREQKRVH